jgi:signal peptidase I
MGNCKLKIANCKLQIDLAPSGARAALGLLQFAICNLQFAICNSRPTTASRPRRYVGAGVLFLSFLLVFRAIGVEPYEVPTGSMAPALAGNHRAVDCPRCGYHVLIGRHRADKGDGRCSPRLYQYAVCPNCGYPHLDANHVPESAGDHLLVNKHVFALRRPRRWEMIVFRLFGKAFIKRLIGLPGEWLEIRDGDVYVNHQLARKTIVEFKAVRVPVFDNNYQPRPEGWRQRWEVVSPGSGSQPLVGTELRLDAEHACPEYLLCTYRHYLLDEYKCQPILDEYGYNGGDPAPAEAVHDFMLECDLEVVEGEGAVMFGLTDGHDHVLAELPVTVNATGSADSGIRLRQMPTPEGTAVSFRPDVSQIVAAARGARLQTGCRYHVELAFVDRRATLTIDGVAPFDPVDLAAVQGRPGVIRPVVLGAKGVKAVVRNFRLFRDLHYTPAGRNAVRGKGVLLGAGQYFVLGDNSPNSEDSRFWPNQGAVPAQDLLGKPFLVHLPSRVVAWDLLGRTGQYQGPDWQRIHWLR